MADVHDKKTRSYNMSRIRGKDTAPEMIVRKFLFSKGIRYRLHQKKLPGKPDLVSKKYNTVVFVNGCFWHGHEGCRYFVIPKTRTEWWKNKISSTVTKDKENYRRLKKMGWQVLIVWECSLRGEKRNMTLENLFQKFTNG
ncbi:MAG: DNA mismatch endonuclease Vsr [Phaeodactylibacter sp.]|nr:DNA mismatch endonuclease Vsr [Phaeodactylibacter sp.]MCB9302642.1 DNA mismatch endonuclease Vsr [Lewinellaceae bacterium]